MTSNEKSAVTFYENEMERTKRNIATFVKNSANLTEAELSYAIRQELVRYDEARLYKDSITTFAKAQGNGQQMNKALINDEIYKSWKNAMYNSSWLHFKPVDSWTQTYVDEILYVLSCIDKDCYKTYTEKHGEEAMKYYKVYLGAREACNAIRNAWNYKKRLPKDARILYYKGQMIDEFVAISYYNSSLHIDIGNYKIDSINLTEIDTKSLKQITGYLQRILEERNA